MSDIVLSCHGLQKIFSQGDYSVPVLGGIDLEIARGQTIAIVAHGGVMDSLYRWMFGQLSINGITLDLDSTVMTRYGAQEGAARG